jgi:hypothetical protein
MPRNVVCVMIAEVLLIILCDLGNSFSSLNLVVPICKMQGWDGMAYLKFPLALKPCWFCKLGSQTSMSSRLIRLVHLSWLTNNKKTKISSRKRNDCSHSTLVHSPPLPPSLHCQTHPPFMTPLNPPSNPALQVLPHRWRIQCSWNLG